MIRKLFCFCLIITASCGSDGNTPDEVLSHDQMTEILLDIYLTEAKLDGVIPRLPRDSTLVAFEILRDSIIEKHSTSDSIFRESMRWYFQNPDHLDKIYSRLIDSLNLKVQQNRAPGEQAL